MVTHQYRGIILSVCNSVWSFPYVRTGHMFFPLPSPMIRVTHTTSAKTKSRFLQWNTNLHRLPGKATHLNYIFTERHIGAQHTSHHFRALNAETTFCCVCDGDFDVCMCVCMCVWIMSSSLFAYLCAFPCSCTHIHCVHGFVCMSAWCAKPSPLCEVSDAECVPSNV